MNILLCFIFFFIVSSSASPLLDVNGDELKPGVQYMMREVSRSVLAPFVTLKSIGGSCPPKIVDQASNVFFPPPLPVTLHPVEKVDYLIDTELNIRTEDANFCPDYTPVWKVGSNGDPNTPCAEPNIEGGGEIGNHTNSVFKLQLDARIRGAYNIYFCPENIQWMCRVVALGPLQPDGTAPWIVTGYQSRRTPVPVVFREIKSV